MPPAKTVGDDEFVPLTVEEARALMTQVAAVDREALLAERAEAEAQLRAAEATLSAAAPPAPGTGRGRAEQEREESAQKPHFVDAHEAVDGWLDVDALREAAAAARAADDELARAASEASDRPPVSEPPGGSAPERLGSAESAFARALELREELPAAWRRLVGALISATGMAIVVGALGWNVYWLLVPIALIAIMTVDLRLAGKAAREASAEAAGELSEVAGAGPDVLEDLRRQREEAEARLAAARAERDAVYDRFDELAPGRLPSEIEEIVAEYERELAEKREAAAAARGEAEAARAEAEAEAARAEAEAGAEAKAQAEAEAARAEAEAEPAPAEPVAAEWWFGSKEPPPVPATASGSVRALAERLSAEGREALARIEAQLAALDRVELAQRSLEWHEQNGSTLEIRPGVGQGPHAPEEPGDGAPGGAAKPPETMP